MILTDSSKRVLLNEHCAAFAQPIELAPRVGVSERGFVASSLPGFGANGEEPSHRTPACCRLILSHHYFSLY
jgi:hypothetical protein